MFPIFLLVLSALFVYTLYLYSKRNHNYWKIKGVKYEAPVPFFGGVLLQYIEKVSLSGRFAKLYREHPNEKYVGFFQGNRPGLLIRDPDLIKHVLVADFRNFHYRGINFHKEASEPMRKNLFNADGDLWKLMRQKLTPAFSTGKLKAMFPLIEERAEKLLKIADGLAKTGDEIDVRDLMARYTTDFIGACGFGIDADTLNDEKSDFRELGKGIFVMSKRKLLVFILKFVAPHIFQHLHTVEPIVEKKLVSLVTQIMSQRNYMPSGRNDFIDMMLELRQKGKIVGESIEKRNPDGSAATVELEVDDLLLTAQVFVFFAAGFETSSSASSFMLHMLAYYPEEQARCQKEVDEVLKKHDGRLSFDAVREMKYLEMVFNESLRILPSPAILLRKAVTKYTIPGTDLTIDADTLVYISTEGLQSDEKYFEDPEQFRPQRFHPDNIENVKKYVYMPFGAGPRACIGERMGIMQSMAGVAAILSKFAVSPSKNSVLKPQIDPKSGIVQTIIGGLPLSLKYRH